MLRRDMLEMPQMPWPLVQPLPSAEPAPTSAPPTTALASCTQQHEGMADASVYC